jgi:hypothetical protein
MRGLCWFILLFLMLNFASKASSQMFRVATWNIENAFDTLHDDGKDDAEFLPHAERRWNSS